MKLTISRIVKITAIAALLLLVDASAFGQTNRITGQVYGPSRRPLADVYVELLNEVNTVLMRTRTSGSGGFQFGGMTSGKFTILVRPFGTDYEEQSQEVEIVNVVIGGRRSSDAANADFYLKPRRNANTPTAAAGVVFAQEIPTDAKKAFDSAVTEFEAKRDDAGIALLETAVRIFPDYYYALDRLGSESLKKQRYADAQKYFERSVAINAKSSNSWYGLAFALFSAGQIDRSIEAGKKAATLAPENTDINLMLGIALRRGRQYTDAEKAMLKAKKLSNGLSADTSWNLALLYAYNLRNQRLAADELENFLKVRPDHPDAERLKRLIRQFRLGV